MPRPRQAVCLAHIAHIAKPRRENAETRSAFLCYVPLCGLGANRSEGRYGWVQCGRTPSDECDNRATIDETPVSRGENLTEKCPVVCLAKVYLETPSSKTTACPPQRSSLTVGRQVRSTDPSPGTPTHREISDKPQPSGGSAVKLVFYC